MKRKPAHAPYPCKCGCGRMVKPFRTDLRGRWTRAKYARPKCRPPRHVVKNVKQEPKPTGTWVYLDRFLYGGKAT